jgi:hypothetical protein
MSNPDDSRNIRVLKIPIEQEHADRRKTHKTILWLACR